MANGERKQDRRTLYTINTIKDSFLKLIQKMPFPKSRLRIFAKLLISAGQLFIYTLNQLTMS